MSLLSSTRPLASTETVLYTVASGKKAVVNVTFNNCNGTSTASIRIGVQSTAGAFAAKDYLFYDLVLPANGSPRQITGISLTEGQSIRVYTDIATVNFHCNGLVENI